MINATNPTLRQLFPVPPPARYPLAAIEGPKGLRPKPRFSSRAAWLGWLQSTAGQPSSRGAAASRPRAGTAAAVAAARARRTGKW
jgi:hypothetical protein